MISACEALSSCFTYLPSENKKSLDPLALCVSSSRPDHDKKKKKKKKRYKTKCSRPQRFDLVWCLVCISARIIREWAVIEGPRCFLYSVDSRERHRQTRVRLSLSSWLCYRPVALCQGGSSVWPCVCVFRGEGTCVCVCRITDTLHSLILRLHRLLLSTSPSKKQTITLGDRTMFPP